jgi:ABC-type uncharacterized transport system permease subunit
MVQREDEFDVELMMESQFRPLWALFLSFLFGAVSALYFELG